MSAAIPSTMRAALWRSNRDIRIVEMPVPAIGPGEILMRVRASGVCGSDVMEWYRLPKAPLVLGHEVAGEVAAVGEGVAGFAIGDRIVATHHVPCGTCRYCRAGHESVCDTLRTTRFEPGGFAEYVRLPAINVEKGTLRLPDEVSFEEGSFAEPLGCVVRGQRLARTEPGGSVLILGAGITGTLHLLLARARGASPIAVTDANERRLETACRLGADMTFRAGDDVARRLRERNEGRLADLVIVCAGVPAAQEEAFACVERGGTLLLFAPLDPGATVRFPFQELWWKEIAIVSSYAASPAELAEALDLVGSRKVDVRPLVTHRLPLEETARGFRLVLEAGDSLKVVLAP